MAIHVRTVFTDELFRVAVHGHMPTDSNAIVKLTTANLTLKEKKMYIKSKHRIRIEKYVKSYSMVFTLFVNRANMLYAIAGRRER